MCYSASSLLDKHLRYIKKYYSDAIEYLAEKQKLLDELEKMDRDNKFYFKNGYDHPNFTIEDQDRRIKSASWGLIPFWTKNRKDAEKIRNGNLNARAETIFELLSYREPARSKRCIIYLDSFFEYYHSKSKTYPFRIQLTNDLPMYMAGLWDEWVDKETGELITTCTIITTTPNKLLRKIHNNPKRNEPRMPVILYPKTKHEWLMPWTGEETKENLGKILIPYPDEEMEAYTVPRLLGKEGVGDSPEALKHFEYKELKIEF